MSGSELIRHRHTLGLQAAALPLGVFCFFASFGLSVASEADDDERPLDVSVDLRGGAKVPEDYAVLFCARGPSVGDRSVSGHAYLIWAYNDDRRRACVAESFGFFPEKDGDVLKSVVADVPGELSASALRNKPSSGECRLVVKVTKAQWEATEKIRADWSKREYRLAKKDCVTFAAAVAERLELKLPDRSGVDNLPARYLRKLAEENKP
ncbi:MAG TPA: hypothetical protein VND64_30140 [Pirellulales bacterium]|nr:hypothetical protein [Pirellulales bacterium]